MSKITFDDIHTVEKQSFLKKMMHEVNLEVLKLPNNRIKEVFCQACGNDQFLYYGKFFEFDMDCCKECGLIFTNPYPSTEQLNHYYNSKMKDFENKFFRESFEKRVELFKPRIQILSKYLKNGSLIDVGSALGVFLEAMRRSDYDSNLQVTCVDMSKNACNELRKEYPEYEVINTNVLELKHSRKFDAITLWDTIEHITDLNSMMQCFKNLLNKDGYLFFSTPNTNSFEWSVAKKEHMQLLPPGHVNLLNPKSINLLLERNGFKVKEMLTLNASLDISYVLKYFVNSDITSTQDPLGLYFANKLKNDDNFNSAFENYLVENTEAGSVLTVAQI